MVSPIEDSSPHLLAQYQDFHELFEKMNAKLLPMHLPYDYTINIQEGKTIALDPIYKLFNEESKVLYAYLTENLEKGSIHQS